MQPTLFEKPVKTAKIEDVLLYALGDFQARGKVLADRKLPLDRLHGAFLRAFAKFGLDELTDMQIADRLRRLGISVEEVPSFVAKRPYRISTPQEVSMNARRIYTSLNDKAPGHLKRNNL